MTESHSAVVDRLSAEFAAMSHQMARISTELKGLDQVLATVNGRLAAAPAPQPAWPHYQGYPAPAAYQGQVWPPQPVAAPQPVAGPPPVAPARHPATPSDPPRQSDGGWIGKVLAVAGVTVTLIGVVLLVVLAAQAGILRPEVRVLAGAALAAALVGIAVRLYGRPGGRTGAVALAATGVAAAYIDVIAVTDIYAWVAAPVGLLVAAVVGGAGLLLARRWDSEALGLLVFIPLIVLGPVVTDGITMLLVGFMLALAAATLPFSLGKDWPWLHAARVAAPTVPLVLATADAAFGSGTDHLLLGAGSLIAALIAVIAAVVLLPTSTHRSGLASVSALGALPVLVAPAALPQWWAAALCMGLAGSLLAVVLVGSRWPGISGPVTHVWSALAAVLVLVAVLAAFDGEAATPVLLALAVVLAVAGRRSVTALWAGIGFGAVGGLLFLAYAPPSVLVEATAAAGPDSVTTLVSSILVAVAAVTIAWVAMVRCGGADDIVKLLWALAVATVVYAVTAFAVTAGVMAGGTEGGFFAGHMAATICWIAMAAGLFGYAARRLRQERSLPIAGGLALTVAATAKLFLFDLGTLSGIFRVVVFIVVGLVLLGMGAGYARLLAQQDEARRSVASQ